MEMNRRGALVLALINISLLFLLVGYPIVKEKIEEADREEIDLGQERAGRKRKKGRSRRRIKERPAGQKLQKAAFPNCRRCL